MSWGCLLKKKGEQTTKLGSFGSISLLVSISKKKSTASFSRQFLQGIFYVPGLLIEKKGEQTTKLGSFGSISLLVSISGKKPSLHL